MVLDLILAPPLVYIWVALPVEPIRYPPNTFRRTSRLAFFCVLTAAALAIFVEIASFIVCTFVFNRLGLMYQPYDTSDYDAYLEIRDPVLGWPGRAELSTHRAGEKSAPDGSQEYDTKGARISPAFPDPDAPPCVSVYGDSFAWSDEVDAQHAWPNVLAGFIHCRVDNFGVSGYGTDQAYLRYRQKVADRKETAPVVVLTVMTENVVRNVNQHRFFLYAADPLGLKPRFVLGADHHLKLIPLPTFTHAQFDRALRNPAAYFPYECVLPGSSHGLIWLRFSYTRAALAAAARLWFICRAKLADLPLFYPFYEPGNPAHAVEVTAAIVNQFRDDVQSRGREPLVVIIPTGYELKYYRRHHIWVHQPLADALSHLKIPVIEFGPEVLARLSTPDPCSIYRRRCSGHLNERGCALLARILEEHLRASSMLKERIESIDRAF